MSRQCKTCRRKAQKGRTECRHCRTEREKQRDPLRYSFQMHRRNARRRKPNHFRQGIPWTLTFDQFQELWEASGKLPEKLKAIREGNTCRWEIDRIDPYKGYEPGNVRIVSKLMNIQYWWNPRCGQMELSFSKSVDPDIQGDWMKQVPF